MFLLVGERLKQKETELGNRRCVVCDAETLFIAVTEQNFFSLFGLPLFPLEKTAEYQRCSRCDSAYAADDLSVPSSIRLGQWALTYIMLGYGMYEYHESAREMFQKVTGFEYPQEEMKAHVRALEAEQVSVMDLLRSQAGTTNLNGKQQILALTYLMTYVSCEVQYEDRLRLNLMGNAMDVSIGFVEVVIQGVRAQQYFGVRRLLKADVTN